MFVFVFVFETVFEIVVVFLLARHNGRIARAKGLDTLKYQAHTCTLLFALGFVGFVVSDLTVGGGGGNLARYPFGIFGGVVGALLANYWVNHAPPAPYTPSPRNPAWRPTHIAPPSGLTGWAVPDTAQTPTAMVPPGSQLVLKEMHGDWARVRGFNGWSGWVDRRQLELIPLEQR